MKRVLVLFLCMLLWMSGCAEETLQAPAEQAPAGAEEPAPEPEDLPAPEAPSAPEPAQAQVQLLEENTARIGIDDLEPVIYDAVDCGGDVYHQSAPEQYTRLRSGRIDELSAGDYGRLYPFAGELHDYKRFQKPKYGLVTADGCIVCDPVYYSVESLKYGSGLFYNRFYHLPLWVLCMNETGYDGKESSRDEGLYGVAALDGSFVLPCRYNQIQGFPCGFAAYTYDPFQAEFYDLDGNLMMTSERLESEYGVDENQLRAEWISSDEENGGYFYFFNGVFFDKDWNPVEFPETMRSGMEKVRFVDGVIPCRPDEAHVGLIDQSGNWVLAPQEGSSDAFGAGAFVIQKEKDYQVFDTKGTQLFAFSGGQAELYDGYVVHQREGNGTDVYAMDGTLLFSAAGRWVYWGSDVFAKTVSEETTLLDLKTGQALVLTGFGEHWEPAELPGSNSIYGGQYVFDGAPCWAMEKYISSDQAGGERLYLAMISKDLKQVTLLQGRNRFWSSVDQITGETCIEFGETGIDYENLAYFRGDGSFLTRLENCSVLFADGYVQITDGETARLYNPDGALVFCCPI